MRYTIGYQLPDELDSTFALCRDFSDAISGVYFSLPGAPSARSVIDPACGEEMFEELKGIAGLQKRLILLYNANCYGAHATSADFRARILADLDFAQRELGVSDVTTASPFVAGVIKDAYPHVQVCASVNMRIGSIPAMQLLTDFDAFYLQRELLYDFERIAILKRWCDAHGKTLRLIPAAYSIVRSIHTMTTSSRTRARWRCRTMPIAAFPAHAGKRCMHVPMWKRRRSFCREIGSGRRIFTHGSHTFPKQSWRRVCMRCRGASWRHMRGEAFVAI